MTEPTWTEAWEHATTRLGLGDYQVNDERPFWEYRMKQVGLLKRAVRNKPHATPTNIMRTVDYCAKRRIKVETVFQLTWHVDDALADWIKTEREFPQQDLNEAVGHAVAQERALDEDSPWISRLLRSTGEHRAAVLEEWRSARA